MKNSYKRLGNYIREVNIRNTELTVTKLLGVSIQKVLIPSIANTVGTDMSTYKILKKGQFAYGPVTSRNGDKISIALLKDYEEAIVSQAYTCFEIINNEDLLPEYLMMWFQRPEFDRYARFKSHGSAREVFDWAEMCNIELPIPSIETQREIVAEYNALQNRIELNNQLIQKLEETAQAIYRQWFVDFEFPNEEGKPYKSSGGEMIESELGPIPKGWSIEKIENISTIKAGGDKPETYSPNSNNNCHIPIYSNGIIKEGLYGYTNQAKYPTNSITISARGTIGYCCLRFEPFDAIVRLLVVIPNNTVHLCYLYFLLKNYIFEESGSVQGQLTVPDILAIKFIRADDTILTKYQINTYILLSEINFRKSNNDHYSQMASILLSKMAKI
ncbi:MAG TPA: hypothetical protein DCF91_08165 [Porphyromonadaceae bacterium]|nr:hypothetical protein [Porphyromonadaceae bacterium]